MFDQVLRIFIDVVAIVTGLGRSANHGLRKWDW